jgi:hypothetical protein
MHDKPESIPNNMEWRLDGFRHKSIRAQHSTAQHSTAQHSTAYMQKAKN